MNTISNYYYLSLFLTITFFFLLSFQETSHAIDTINTSQIFRDNGTTLVSSGGTFELGFFSPDNSKNRYVGIWYNKIPGRTIVWVANRQNPLTDTSGTLQVVKLGILALLNSTNGIIWSTNTSKNVQNPFAQLLDSGNLVVKDADVDKPENLMWQSFDYPTDTLLPGMKLGWNFITGREVYLTSWKNSVDPQEGDYSYHFSQTNYPQLVIKKGTDHVVHRTGPWNGVTFGWNPNYRNNNIFTIEVVVNENEVYFVNEQLSESALTRLKISESGVVQRFVWDDQRRDWMIYYASDGDNCARYGACGAYGSCNAENSPVCGCLNKFEPKDSQGWGRGDWSNGCVQRTPLDCQKGDAFLKYSDIKLPDTQNSSSYKSMTLEECRVICLKNCSCSAYASLDISRGGDGCLLWFGDLVDIREISNISPGQDIYIRIASSELDSNGRKREMLIVLLSLVTGIILLSLSTFVAFQRRKKRKTGRLRLNYGESDKDLEILQFNLAKIAKATDNFSINNKLGEGGFGTVYKGRIEEGPEIAVKRLSRASLQGVDEFKNEVICIAKLQHRNLVKLLGWCIHGEDMMLVYEYMANKSLDLILFDQAKSIILDWPTRYNIINGIARALLYLHQDSRLRVIHRDMKASNILLDSDMNPKISDFGLARMLGGNETGAKTNRLVGTYGYISPEYATYGQFSVKSDVFSFGVIVLEIISGKRNTRFTESDHHLSLLGHAWMLYREGRSSELVDSCIRNSCNLSEVLHSIHIGLLCVQARLEDRPIMSSVVRMLGNDSVLPEAKQPGFFIGGDIVNTKTPIIINKRSSSNEISISLLEAR